MWNIKIRGCEGKVFELKGGGYGVFDQCVVVGGFCSLLMVFWYDQLRCMVLGKIRIQGFCYCWIIICFGKMQ